MPTGESMLPPTESLGADEFEDFTERLLNAQKFATHAEARCIEVARWGRRGDKQDGIDFAGRLSDQRRAAWQCKSDASFAPAKVREAVTKTTYPADVHHLVLSCEASSSVRLEMDEHPGWVLLDKRGLGQLLDDLPLHKRREVLDATWGPSRRRTLMSAPGEDRFITLSAFAASRRDAAAALNDLGALAGRGDEIEKIREATDRSRPWPRVVLVTGPGGRGKTRILVEALSVFEVQNPQVPLLVLSDGMLGDPGIVEELPHGPATIVVDDAHLDPEALQKFAGYAGHVDGTQLVVASRPSALASVRAQLVKDLAPDQVRTVDLGELDLRDARRLVERLSKDITVPWQLKERLAGQAVHSPHVAVIAVNLIRSGQLSGALDIDESLRERVLARYRDLTTVPVAGFAPDTVNRVLAVHAALGGVDDADVELRQRVADVVGITVRELLAVREGLLDGGVLVSRASTTQVVPEILADTTMEREAVLGGVDTGFARDLWAAFGQSHGHRLMLALADLDRRLAEQNGPGVIETVWSDFSARLLVTDLDELSALVIMIERLATTLPGRFLSLLEDLRGRLHREVDGSSGDGAGDPATSGLRGPWTAGVREARSRYGSVPAHEVLERLAPLYAACATADPTLLEAVLDALWDPRQRDQQPRHLRDDHLARVAVDQLADLGHVRDLSVPGRIVDRVESWLQEPPLNGAEVTPLFALRNLTAKGGGGTVQTGPRTLQLTSYSISPEQVRPLRDRVRTVLKEQIAGRDLRRAADGVDLLARMLRQPGPPPGASFTTDDVLVWEDDDLATLTVLDAASRVAPSAVVRRGISRLVAWSAEHACSIPVRHAALVLQTTLDDREADDLAEVLLPGRATGGPPRRGVVVPDLDDFAVGVEAERARRAALSDVDLTAEHEARIETSVQRSLEGFTAGTACHAIAAHLASTMEPVSMMETMDRLAREVVIFERKLPPRLWKLYQAFGAAVPASVPALVRAIADLDAGPLDADLHVLLEAWRQHDGPQLLTWLGDLGVHRPAVRIAVASAFDAHGWDAAGQAYVSLFEQGVADPRPEVRDEFWRASGALLAADPRAVSQRLVAASASSSACGQALERAARLDGRAWGERLTAHDASSVLRVVDRAGWKDWTRERIITGIATRHPLVVLQHLAGIDAVSTTVDSEVEGLAQVLDSHGEVLARWLVDRGTTRPSPSGDDVVAVVLADGLGVTTAAALERLVPDLDEGSLAHLLAALDPLGGPSALSAWPQHRPGVARAVLHRARALGPSAVSSTLTSLESAMSVRSWTSVNGVSDELVRALDVTTTRADDEPEEELRELYERARDRIAAQTRQEEQRYDADEE